MKRFILPAIILSTFLLVFSFQHSGIAGTSSPEFKNIMGSNFGHLQKILIDLIRSDYSTVPKDVAVIEDHAKELTLNVPDAAKINRAQFLAIAYNLQSHAANLRIVAESLRQQDKNQTAGLLNVDYLRSTAAAHYGEMVATCVACHNQFRRKVAP